MRHEKGVDISGDPNGIVGQGHRGAANDEKVGDNASPDETVTKSREGSLELGSAEEAVVCHAAWRS